MRNSHREARIDLAAAHRLAVMDGLHEGTWNHFSVCLADGSGQMLVTPAACHWKMVTASSLIRIDRDGKKVEGEGEYDPSAYFIHYPIHNARRDAVCVLHAHPPYATALSMVENGRLQMADQNTLGMYGRIAYFDTWDGYVMDLDHGRRLADVLGDNRVLFLSNHGVVVVGPSVAAAYSDLYKLERACMLQCHAMSMGGKLRRMPHELASQIPAFLDNEGYGAAGSYKVAYFAAMKRLLDLEQPTYSS
jgi:ribulose-5-phosphate 4-epimerase/fuculose-1-phosphate aldolase